MEEKRIVINLSGNRHISLLFTRPTPAATWVCQASDEILDDIQDTLKTEDKEKSSFLSNLFDRLS